MFWCLGCNILPLSLEIWHILWSFLFLNNNQLLIHYFFIFWWLSSSFYWLFFIALWLISDDFCKYFHLFIRDSTSLCMHFSCIKCYLYGLCERKCMCRQYVCTIKGSSRFGHFYSADCFLSFPGTLTCHSVPNACTHYSSLRVNIL